MKVILTAYDQMHIERLLKEIYVELYLLLKFGIVYLSYAEEKFVQLFCDVYGPEKGRYVYLQFPFLDIYGKHRTIDFAIRDKAGKIAFEIDGNT